MHNSFLLTGIKYIYWIRSYVTNTWVCLGVFLILIYELWLFQVPGSRARSFFLGSGFFAEANSTLVAGRGPVGLWGCGVVGRGAGVMKAQVDHRNCEDWIDPTGSLPQSKSFPGFVGGFMVWRCQSSATKLKLLQRLGFGDVAVVILREILWGLNWNHLGSEPLGGS